MIKLPCNKSLSTTVVTKPGTKARTKSGNFDVTAQHICNQVLSEPLHQYSMTGKNTGKRQSHNLNSVINTGKAISHSFWIQSSSSAVSTAKTNVFSVVSTKKGPQSRGQPSTSASETRMQSVIFITCKKQQETLELRLKNILKCFPASVGRGVL